MEKDIREQGSDLMMDDMGQTLRVFRLQTYRSFLPAFVGRLRHLLSSVYVRLFQKSVSNTISKCLTFIIAFCSRTVICYSFSLPNIFVSFMIRHSVRCRRLIRPSL
jgi:hypothetical protein